MSKRIAIAVTFIGVIAVLGPRMGAQVPAGPWPYDEPAPLGITRGLGSLPTLNLLPGEIDPGSVGVSDQELTMSGSMSSSGSSHSSHPSHQDCSHNKWCSHNGPCSHFNRILVVDDDRAQCPTAPFTSVQDAVDASLPGDKIKACPGTYTEQVVIPSSRNNIMLYSSEPWQAKITYPVVPTDAVTRAVVRVNGAKNVTIRDFTITGPGPAGCDSIRWGIRVDNSGSATIVGNHIAEIRDTPFSGCQNGIGILVGRNSEMQSASALIVHNVLDGYQKGAMVIDGIFNGTSSFAEIAYNLIYGAGPTPIIAQNGIQVGRNAVAKVHYNRVTNNNYSNPGTTSAGVLMFGEKANASVVRKNAVAYNDDGLDLFGSEGTEVSFNWFLQNDVDGIWAGDDTFFNFKQTLNNTIKYNLLQQNAEHDCHDDTVGTKTAGTANFWFKNIGDTETPTGICKSSSW